MKILVTRKIPDGGLKLLETVGYEVAVNPNDRPLTKEELVSLGRGVSAILSQLTDNIDREVILALKDSLKVVANYAVGFDNIDLAAAAEFGVTVTNTPGVLTETVAEHTFALILSIAHRIAEADRFARAGRYHGWEPELLLGTDVSRKKLGILGCGRIGSLVAEHGAKGFGMEVLYYDMKRNEALEKDCAAHFSPTIEGILGEADFVSIHVPLLDSTRHLINAERLRLMKPTAYLVNTSRGPVIDEAALAEALKGNVIKGAALDVYENEPEINPVLKTLDNVILTPHIASATYETRDKMGELAAKNIIEVLSGRPALNPVTLKK